MSSESTFYCPACGHVRTAAHRGMSCGFCGSNLRAEQDASPFDPPTPEPFARSYDCQVAEPLRGSVTLDALVTVEDASRIAAECRTAAVVSGSVTFFLVNGVLRLTIDDYTVFG